MKLFKSRNFKFGTFATVLSVAVVAVVIVFNIIVQNLCNSLDLYFDMTSESIYSVSDETKSLLDKVDADSNDVTIYFFADADLLTQGATSANYYSQSGLWGMKPIHELALYLAETYSFISVDYIDATSEPNRIKAIVGEDEYEDYTFSRYTIIVDNKTELVDQNGNVYDTNHTYRVFARDSFYNYNYSSYAVDSFGGDYRLCAAIVSTVTQARSDAPVAYFISGHGEGIGTYSWNEENDDDASYANAQSLWQLFHDCGYTVRKINLAYEDFDMNADGVAVIYGPRTDYITDTNSQQFDEIAKINSYLSSPNHSLMVYLDAETKDLPNLEKYMSETFGIVYDKTKLKDDGTNAISVDGYSIVGEYVGNTNLSEEDVSNIKTVFQSTGTITAASDSVKVLYQAPASSNYTGDTQPALAVSAKTSSGATVFACATTYFAGTYYTDNINYLNREILLDVVDDMSDDDIIIPKNVDFKSIASDGLDITTKEARIWTVILAVGLPAVIAVAGIIVYVRRRHS